MKSINKTISVMLMFLLVLTLFSTIVLSLNVSYYDLSNNLIQKQELSGNTTLNLPNTTLRLEIEDSAIQGKITVIIPKLNVSEVPEINITSRNINANSVSNETLKLGSAERYKPFFAHAFDLEPQDDIDNNYSIEMQFKASPEKDVIMFKCEYDFSINQTNFSSCIETKVSDINRIQKVATVAVENFSIFILAEDSSSPVSPPSGGTSGGGGGGGGASVMRTIVVVPTTQGVVVPGEQGSSFQLIFAEETHHLDFTFNNPDYARLRDKATGISYTFIPGVPATLRLGRYSVNIVLGPQDGKSRNFVFSLPAQPSRPPMEILPPVQPEPRDDEEIVTPELPTQPSPEPLPPATAEPVEQTPEVVEKSNYLVSILLSLLFVFVLIGGIVAYHQYTELDKPPAAIRTGLDGPRQELSGPAPFSAPKTPELKHVIKKENMQPKSIAIDIGSKHYDIKESLVKGIEKFVHDGLVKGYDREALVHALENKGWPILLINYIVDHADFVHEEVSKAHKSSSVNDSIKELLAKGFDKEHIKSGLLKKGWTEEQIFRVFKEIKP